MAESFNRWERDTLIQLVEQVKGLREEMNTHDESDRQMFQSLRNILDEKYVTKADFGPTKAIAYGIVSVFMLAVLTAIAALVVMGGKK